MSAPSVSYGSRLAQARPRPPERPGTSGMRRCPLPARASRASEETARNPVNLLLNDLSFLEDRTGLDLHTGLQTLAGAHEEIVSVLNPLAGEAMQRSLEEQIAGLQQELAVAHQQMHSSESLLGETVDNLAQLEAGARQAFATPLAEPPQQQQRQPRQQPKQQQQFAARGAVERRRGLDSSLDLPPQLKEFWFPVDFSASLAAGKLVPIELFNESWVLFRDETGAAACVKDECAHRACPLSLGRVVDGQVECPYHGWRFDKQGDCTRMPSTRLCKGVGVTALQVFEAEGLVWVWPGVPGAATGPPLDAVRPPAGYTIHAELVLDVPVEHGLLLENLLDLAHAPFTHTSTFAKGWPVPDAVRFHAEAVLGGRWDPYPIEMEFAPPCMVLSTIGLAQPGKIEQGATASACSNHLHQLHVCLPSSEGRTRLLYRMSLDFMGWVRHVPFITAVWERVARQVMGEDLVLVAGQQDRLERGANVWNNPVPYDKLGVRYRRWRNSVASGDRCEVERAQRGLRAMSAGELFSPDDSVDDSECSLGWGGDDDA